MDTTLSASLRECKWNLTMHGQGSCELNWGDSEDQDLCHGYLRRQTIQKTWKILKIIIVMWIHAISPASCVAGREQCSSEVMLCASESGLSHWWRDTSVIDCSHYQTSNGLFLKSTWDKQAPEGPWRAAAIVFQGSGSADGAPGCSQHLSADGLAPLNNSLL